MSRFLPAIFAIAIAATAAAQVPATTPTVTPNETITVTGTGRATVTPDRFTFSVGVQTIADTVDQAVNENNSRIAAVIAALKRAGAGDKDIRTSNFAIWPQQDYTQGKLPKILGYQVSNNITVRRENVADAGKLLQAAISAGVNTSTGLQFEVSDPARGRDQAMKGAYDEARSKAALLAQAAGRTLGRAMSIVESGMPGPYPPPRPMEARALQAGAVSDVPVEAGSQETTYSVSVIFELR